MTDEELAALGQPESDYQELAPDKTPEVGGDEEPAQPDEVPVGAPKDDADALPEQFKGKTPAELASIALENKKYADRQSGELGELRKLAQQSGYVKGEDGRYYPVMRQEEERPPQEQQPSAVDHELQQIADTIAVEKYNELLEITSSRLAAKGEIDADADNVQVAEWLKANRPSKFAELNQRAVDYGQQQAHTVQTLADRRAEALIAPLEAQLAPVEISSAVTQTVSSAGIVGLTDEDVAQLASDISRQVNMREWRAVPRENREAFIIAAAQQKAYQVLAAKMQSAPSDPEPPARTPDPVGTTPPRQVAQVDARMTAQAEALMRDVPGLSKEDALDIVKRSK